MERPLNPLSQVEREIKRKANQQPVHWAWWAAMIACAGLVVWFLIDTACDWIESLMVVQAQIMAYTLR